MASGKRASMREGPLADLFRKTEQAAEEAENPTPPTPAADEGQVPAPSTPAGQERRAPEPPPPHPRETGYPHPSLGTTEEAAEAADQVSEETTADAGQVPAPSTPAGQ